MVIPRVENFKEVKKIDTDEIWVFDYQRMSLENKIRKLFLKYRLKYPKKGFYEECLAGTILHTNTNCLIFINIIHMLDKAFFQDCKKIGNLRNFSSGFKIVSIRITKYLKVFEYFGLDPNQIENQKFEIISINANNLYFIKRRNLGYFILPRSLSDYFHQLLKIFSRNLNLSSKDTVELENYFNLLAKNDA